MTMTTDRQTDHFTLMHVYRVIILESKYHNLVKGAEYLLDMPNF